MNIEDYAYVDSEAQCVSLLFRVMFALFIESSSSFTLMKS